MTVIVLSQLGEELVKQIENAKGFYFRGVSILKGRQLKKQYNLRTIITMALPVLTTVITIITSYFPDLNLVSLINFINALPAFFVRQKKREIDEFNKDLNNLSRCNQLIHQIRCLDLLGELDNSTYEKFREDWEKLEEKIRETKHIV